MRLDLLQKHVKDYLKHIQDDSATYQRSLTERRERVQYYQSWTADRLRNMTEDKLYQYISKLWGIQVWGNKRYVVGKLIEDNEFSILKNELAELVWGNSSVDVRWDRFRSKITGMGPAMMSEILCHAHPKDCVLWNRRAYVGFSYLGIENLPRYDYQITGKRYLELSQKAKTIASEMCSLGIAVPDLMTVDYFIWNELQYME
jgi:hypothetical protein